MMQQYIAYLFISQDIYAPTEKAKEASPGGLFSFFAFYRAGDKKRG